MFCPSCGANNTTEQKYCRSCGLNLEKTAESLLEQIPSAESAKLLRRERSLEKFGNIALGGFGLALFTGIGTVIYFIFVKMILSGESVFGGIMLIAFIIFSALSLAYVAFNEDLKERKKKINQPVNNELTERKETAKLLEEKFFEPVPSVTEDSAELLRAKNKIRRF